VQAIPHQVLPIVLPSGHHLYSCPKIVGDDVFPTKKIKIRPVMMMMIAFITFKSSLVPLFEGL